MNKKELQWEENFQLVKKYYEEHGDLLIPDKYITKDGIKLGIWIGTQRQAYKSAEKSKITSEQIEKLNSIHMVWDVLEAQWEKNFKLAKQYYKKHGDLLISTNYTTEDGFKLGRWIKNQRQAYKGTGKSKITPEKIEKLNDIHMVWDVKKGS